MTEPVPVGELGLSATQGQLVHGILAAKEHRIVAETRASTWQDVMNSRVAKAMAKGVPAEALAKALGVSVQRVYQMRGAATDSEGRKGPGANTAPTIN